MKLNHMICPNCGHDFYVTSAYATCDACQTIFYAVQSRTCDLKPLPFAKVYINGKPAEEYFKHADAEASSSGGIPHDLSFRVCGSYPVYNSYSDCFPPDVAEQMEKDRLADEARWWRQYT